MQKNPTYPITVYGKPDNQCFGCKKTKAKFDAAGVEYEFFDLTRPENEPLLEALKDHGIQSVPHVETPDGDWTGMNPPRINAAISAYHLAVAA